MSDPASAAPLLLMAATGSTISSLTASKQQKDLEVANIRADSEYARLETAQQAYSSANNFRQALASQLAISSMRGSNGSIARQFASNSLSNMFADSGVFDRRQQYTNTSEMLKVSNAKASSFARDANAITGLLMTGIQATNMSSNKG